MIAVDTSALMAILLNEAEARACAAILEAESVLLISAGTLAEALIVAARRNLGDEMAQLVAGLGFTVEAVSQAGARRAADAYGRWGKGIHPAGLNFGDCFSYEIATTFVCPLLFVGNDFRQTDVVCALAA